DSTDWRAHSPGVIEKLLNFVVKPTTDWCVRHHSQSKRRRGLQRFIEVFDLRRECCLSVEFGIAVPDRFPIKAKVRHLPTREWRKFDAESSLDNRCPAELRVNPGRNSHGMVNSPRSAKQSPTGSIRRGYWIV